MSFSEQLEDRIDHFFINNEDLTKNEATEGVGWLVNGNLCLGVFDNLLVVRPDPQIAYQLLREPHIDRFPHQKGSGDIFISITENIYRDNKALHKFLNHALKYTSTLPPNDTASSK